MLALAAAALAIPLHFEENRGQWDRRLSFQAVTQVYTLELSDTAVTMKFRGRPVAGSVAGIGVSLKIPRTRPEGIERVAATSSYYFGADSSEWRTGIPNFARVRYRDVFRGVDLVVYGNDGKVEYDWIVAPGADPRSIHFSFSDATDVALDSNGDLTILTSAGVIRNTAPRIFQGDRQVAGRFMEKGGEFGFEVGAYDRTSPLIIDPMLVVSTLFGGNGSVSSEAGRTYNFQDTGTAIAVDPSGNIYVAGLSFSADFPLVNALGPAPPCPANELCAYQGLFVTKLSPDASTLLYSTYIGSPLTLSLSTTIQPPSIAVDQSGTAYVAGATYGTNFPGVTATAGGADAFLLRLDPNGALLGTTLFGGSGDEAATSITLGPDGLIYLAGITASSNFPVTPNSYRAPSPGPSNVFVVKIGFNSLFGPTNGTVVYSAVIGPTGCPCADFPGRSGNGAAVAADSNGNAYLAAATDSTAWQTTPGVVQPACAGSNCADIFIAKLDPLGQRLLYGTYLGGSGIETPGGIAVDSSGSAYISGGTSSTDFPATAGALKTNWAPENAPYSYTGFVAKLSPDATKLAYATYLGGSANDQAVTVAVDSSGSAYVGGAAASPDFPLRYPIQFTPFNTICYQLDPDGNPIFAYQCATAGFLSVVNPSGSALLWSTYLGSGVANAVALDTAGDVYATGMGIAPGQTPVYVGNPSVGVVKIAPGGSNLDVPPDGLVNAASYAPGFPLFGGLASLFVRGLNVANEVVGSGSPLPTELAGVSILVDGVSAPILAIAPLSSGVQQINFQVPFEASTNAVEVRYQGYSVYAFPQTAAPGVFTFSDGTPAIQHASDYSLVTPSNPAHPGEAIIVYATGLGKVSPPAVSGVAATGPATVNSICGISVGQSMPPFWTPTILYAGLTPGAVGLYQLNLQLPAGVPSGTAQFDIYAFICSYPLVSLDSGPVSIPVQ